ncbi:MAG: type III-A CRISPR-associated protein Cas10/Csm1, partial [Clostridiaceae bacterium]|nr:type III-A CRISPR-associated protein Cas10/Csm1 [Clostridiaceae bacterium]
LYEDMNNSLKAIPFDDSKYLNSINNIFEAYTSYIPSSTSNKEISDISLFDHSRLTAAVASCMFDWFEENNITNYKELCMENNQKLRQEKLFLIAHADMSGIQDFIYRISSKGALKSLRGRSFYLELILEQMADELLEALELSLMNLLYTGGGGFYLLLPNTKKVKTILSEAHECYNDYLLKYFKTQLYLALAWEEASPANFMSSGKYDSPGTAPVFKSVSQKLGIQKLNRYSEKQLERLFEPEKPEYGTRECTVCGTSSLLVSSTAGRLKGDVCRACLSLYELGSRLVNKENDREETWTVFAVRKEAEDNELQLPAFKGSASLCITSLKKARELQNSGVFRRIYSKNHLLTGLNSSVRLWVGDYAYCRDKDTTESFDFKDLLKYSGREKGIERLGVLRADVDNLGQLFSQGFRKESGYSSRYETLSRYAVLSRSLSRFFKGTINHLAKGDSGRNLVIVYSGGDDVFVAGYWADVIDFALSLRHAFRIFSNNRLSFSAGIGFFRHDFPISRMAEITGELEGWAKQGNKDKVALFGIQMLSGHEICRHVYEWNTFENEVLPKAGVIDEVLKFSGASGSQDRTGMSFIYKLMNILLEAESDSGANSIH